MGGPKLELTPEQRASLAGAAKSPKLGFDVPLPSSPLARPSPFAERARAEQERRDRINAEMVAATRELADATRENNRMLAENTRIVAEFMNLMREIDDQGEGWKDGGDRA